MHANGQRLIACLDAVCCIDLFSIICTARSKFPRRQLAERRCSRWLVSNAVVFQLLHVLSGDAYRYTIQPMFHGLRSDVQCHVQRRQLNVLYELFFFLQLPLSKTPPGAVGPLSGAVPLSSSLPGEPLFQTPKVYRTVRADSGDRHYRTRGQYTADYLTVEHYTGLDLNDELILRRYDGQPTVSGSVRATGAPSRGFNYTVRPAINSRGRRRDSGGDTVDRPPVHEISRNIYVVSTQFERPFDYSTSTW